MLPLLGMMMTVMATVTVTVTLTVTMIATNDCINISQLIDLNWQANFVWNLIFLCEEAVLQLSNYTWNIRKFIHWKEIIWSMFENNNAEATTFLFIDFHCNWWKQSYAYSLRNTIWRNWHFFHHSVSQWMFIDTEFWKKMKSMKENEFLEYVHIRIGYHSHLNGHNLKIINQRSLVWNFCLPFEPAMRFGRHKDFYFINWCFSIDIDLYFSYRQNISILKIH